MKKQCGYFMGGVFLILNLAVYMLLVVIIGAILGIVSVPVTMLLGFSTQTWVVVLMAFDFLAALAVVYFGTKRFLKNTETPNNKKLVVSVVGFLVLLDLSVNMFYGQFEPLVFAYNLSGAVLVYLTAAYSLKKNLS